MWKLSKQLYLAGLLCCSSVLLAMEKETNSRLPNVTRMTVTELDEFLTEWEGQGDNAEIEERVQFSYNLCEMEKGLREGHYAIEGCEKESLFPELKISDSDKFGLSNLIALRLHRIVPLVTVWLNICKSIDRVIGDENDENKYARLSHVSELSEQCILCSASNETRLAVPCRRDGVKSTLTFADIALEFSHKLELLKNIKEQQEELGSVIFEEMSAEEKTETLLIVQKRHCQLTNSLIVHINELSIGVRELLKTEREWRQGVADRRKERLQCTLF